MKLIIFGPPGSGKGTIATLLKNSLKLQHLSTGEIFREELKRKTRLGKEAHDKYWKQGKLVPDKIVINIVKNKLKKIKDNFILDGFPRTKNQAKELDNFSPIDQVIVLDVPYHVLKTRLLRRAKLEGREDDNEETIKERFKVYRQESEPLLKHYKNKILLVDADHTPEETYNFIFNELTQ